MTEQGRKFKDVITPDPITDQMVEALQSESIEAPAFVDKIVASRPDTAATAADPVTAGLTPLEAGNGT